MKKISGLILTLFMFPFIFIGFISAMIYVAVCVGMDYWHDFVKIYMVIDKKEKKERGL